MKEKDKVIQELLERIANLEREIERLNNIISKIETLVINHNCDTGDIYYKYNGRYLKSELKDRILELLELKEKDKVIQELLERIANLERNIEEAREFLVHSSISIEDMERVDEIFGL